MRWQGHYKTTMRQTKARSVFYGPLTTREKRLQEDTKKNLGVNYAEGNQGRPKREKKKKPGKRSQALHVRFTRSRASNQNRGQPFRQGLGGGGRFLPHQKPGQLTLKKRPQGQDGGASGEGGDKYRHPNAAERITGICLIAPRRCCLLGTEKMGKKHDFLRERRVGRRGGAEDFIKRFLCCRPLTNPRTA